MLTVTVTRKNIRSLRLRIDSAESIALSIPFFVTNATAESFVRSKESWIQKTLTAYRKRSAQYTSLRPDCAASHAGLTVQDFNPVYTKKWKTAAMTIFQTTTEKYLPAFDRGITADIQIRGRSMKRLWGSCNRNTKVLTFNWALLRAPETATEYVILHELTHLLYIQHDYDFYHFIEILMPDYKDRSRMLNTEIGII